MSLRRVRRLACGIEAESSFPMFCDCCFHCARVVYCYRSITTSRRHDRYGDLVLPGRVTVSIVLFNHGPEQVRSLLEILSRDPECGMDRR